MDIDHELFSIVILFLPVIQNVNCQLQAKACTQSTAKSKPAPEKLDMAMTVY